MTLDELRLFLAIIQHGGVSAAGRSLGLSPAAASARLQSLENSLRASLFARTTRRLRLTEEGEALRGHAERALAELGAAADAVQNLSAEPSGALRLNIPATFGPRHMLPYLRDFCNKFPKVEANIELTDDLVDVVGGGYDVVVRVGRVADSALKATKLAPNRRVLVAAPDYIARCGAPEKPEDLSRHSCMLIPNHRSMRFLRGAEERLVAVSGPIQTNSGDALRQSALLGLGIAQKSMWDVGEDIAKGRLVQLLPDWRLGEAGAIWALRPPNVRPTPRVRAFIDFFKEKYGPEPYWERPSL